MARESSSRSSRFLAESAAVLTFRYHLSDRSSRRDARPKTPAAELERRAEKRLLRRALRSPRRFGRFHRRLHQQSPTVVIRRHRGVNRDRRGPVACGGVLRSSRVARVRNAPQPEPSPAHGQKPAGPANVCEWRDSRARWETARAGPSPEQLRELLPLCPRPGAKVSRAVEQFAGAAGFWPIPADLRSGSSSKPSECCAERLGCSGRM